MADMLQLISGYLGRPAVALLQDLPFREWPVTRCLDEEIQSLTYDFENHGVQLRCDLSDSISSIFVSAADPSALVQPLVEIPFSLSRNQVLERLGLPEKSGQGRQDPIIGEYGDWDRFERSGYFVHIEYLPGTDRINLITYMRHDVVP